MALAQGGGGGLLWGVSAIVSALLIPSQPSQPRPGSFCHNPRYPQGATIVRPLWGHLPEEALHFCWVTSVVFSGAFSDTT